MQAIGFPGAFASAAKIASRCGFEDADDPVVADRIDKLDRWHAARRNGLNADDAAHAVGVPRATFFRWDRRRREGGLKPAKTGPAPLARPREAGQGRSRCEAGISHVGQNQDRRALAARRRNRLGNMR